MSWRLFWEWLRRRKQPPAWREAPVPPELADPVLEDHRHEACQPLGEDD